eukprot:scaffold130102_cov63-Phaeocystis_antarctica.AAC.1
MWWYSSGSEACPVKQKRTTPTWGDNETTSARASCGAAHCAVQYVVHGVVRGAVHGRGAWHHRALPPRLMARVRVRFSITATPTPPGACPCDASERCVLSCGARELATSHGGGDVAGTGGPAPGGGGMSSSRPNWTQSSAAKSRWQPAPSRESARPSSSSSA